MALFECPTCKHVYWSRWWRYDSCPACQDRLTHKYEEQQRQAKENQNGCNDNVHV